MYLLRFGRLRGSWLLGMNIAGIIVVNISSSSTSTTHTPGVIVSPKISTSAATTASTVMRLSAANSATRLLVLDTMISAGMQKEFLKLSFSVCLLSTTLHQMIDFRPLLLPDVLHLRNVIVRQRHSDLAPFLQANPAIPGLLPQSVP